MVSVDTLLEMVHAARGQVLPELRLEQLDEVVDADRAPILLDALQACCGVRAITIDTDKFDRHQDKLSFFAYVEHHLKGLEHLTVLRIGTQRMTLGDVTIPDYLMDALIRNPHRNSLATLNLGYPHSPRVLKMLFERFMDSLESLRVDNRPLPVSFHDDFPPEETVHLPKLKHLSIAAWSEVHFTSIIDFLRLDNLQELKLAAVAVTYYYSLGPFESHKGRLLQRIHGKYPGLRRLELTDTTPEGRAWKTFDLGELLPQGNWTQLDLKLRTFSLSDTVPAPSPIQKLELEGCRLASWSILRSFPDLQELVCRSVQVEEDAPIPWNDWFSRQLTKVNNLEFLSMYTSNQGLEGLVLALTSENCALRSLSLTLYPGDYYPSLRQLAQCSCLKRLRLESFDDPSALFQRTSTATVEALTQGLRLNDSLENLSIDAIDAAGSDAIFGCLTGHAPLRMLVLDRVVVNTAPALLRLLRQSSLTTLHWINSAITAEGLNALCDGLGGERSVPFHLNLLNSTLPEGGLVRLGELFTSSSRLKHLSFGSDEATRKLWPFGRERKSINRDDLLRFFTNLSTTALRTHIDARVAIKDAQLAATILEAVKSNPSIIAMDNLGMAPQLFLLNAEIQHFVACNRAGRLLLTTTPAPSMGFWPLVLERSTESPGVLYHFLRSKPDLVKDGTAGPVRRDREEV